ncbi:hypothetical protein KY290_026094 [Solanum tuberosum]|uniref:Uncharacterized protein n=1 Tax=Solanum tuberosum TaxID=4113 RepID=A0ABQ7UVK8_SOLTU|nr:hypothetical protein KY284_024962 [Solanum tuberosum]KAH0755824.1 hypothetical protein KY290_026094 [Solanum tuberosum]
MNNIKVVEEKSQFKTQQFLNVFISFDEAGKITDGSFFVKALNGEGRSIRREVIVIDDRYDRKVMTLWGDFAKIEGQMLQSLETNNLQQWKDSMKAQKIDIRLMPSRLMQIVRQVRNTNILNGSLAIVKDMYYKFNPTVSGINNNTDSNTDLWYHACKKYCRRVTVINNRAICTYGRTEDIDYEER